MESFNKTLSWASDDTVQYWAAQYCFSQSCYYRDNTSRWWRREVEKEATRRGLPREHDGNRRWWQNASREYKKAKVGMY